MVACWLNATAYLLALTPSRLILRQHGKTIATKSSPSNSVRESLHERSRGDGQIIETSVPPGRVLNDV